MYWLQGGPFFVLSFLLPVEIEIQAFITRFLSMLNLLKSKVTIALTENELGKEIDNFVIGYPYDIDDIKSIICRILQIPIYVNLDQKRKSTITIYQTSTQLFEVEIDFFGSITDAPEWDQAGITDNQLPAFKEFFFDLYNVYNFIIGTMGYETSASAIDLFDSNAAWPNEDYIIKNISQENIKKYSSQEDNVLIIANKSYIKISDIEVVTESGTMLVIGRDISAY